MPTLDELRREQVTVDSEGLDRLSRTGSLPTLQSSGQLVTFRTQHRGQPLPAPVLVQQMTDPFVRAVRTLAAAQQEPRVHFEHGVRNDAVAAAQRARFTGTEGGGVIGVAHAKAHAFKASNQTAGTAGNLPYSRPAVSGASSSFSLLDDDCGPAVITVCSDAPVTLTVCLNGQEWAKRPVTKAGSACDALDHGFRACADPTRLQAVCATLGVEPIPAFFERGLARLPLPLPAR